MVDSYLQKPKKKVDEKKNTEANRINWSTGYGGGLTNPNVATRLIMAHVWAFGQR